MTDQPRPRRSLPDLSKLYDSIEETKVDSLLDLAKTEASGETPTREVAKIPFRPDGEALRLDPALKDYLPPDLWRKLNSDTPRSGIYINALDRLNSLLYTISTYIPGDLVQEKINHPIPGLVDGKMLDGCLLFSDVSGFTALSERLAGLGPQGAEHLTGFINQYFTTMIDIISWSNGTLLKFAGDATLIHFPAQANGEHVRWAARAGLRMLRAMGQFSNLPTPLGPVSLSMKLGLASGPFLAASIGSPKRMEYALIGSAVWQTMQAEGNSSSGNMVVNQDAADILKADYPLSEVKPGFYLLKAGKDDVLDEFEIRPERRRARRSMAWDASVEELNAELDKVLQQIQSLTPYLASELVDRIITHAYQRQVQSEYRPTTVMFCNFTGPEDLLGQWGDSGAQRVTGLLSAYFNDMNEVITRFGGIVSRIDPYSQGTKMLVLFGAPVAHEDDPQRAVGAALAMNNALIALNRRWAQKLARHLAQGAPEVLIEHRIGITLGETFAGQAGSSTRREYTVMGDEVNLAARLMSAAVPGQILISEPVLERVDTYYVSRKLPPVRVKGKKKPIPIFQVDGPREDTLLNRIRTRPALIGRAPEMKRAWQVFQRAAQEGQGSVISLGGPAGIGKSHLADGLLNQAIEQGWQVQAFQCRSYLADESYACWSGLIRSLSGMTSIDHPLIQYEKLERFVEELSLPGETLLALVNLLGLRQAQVDAVEEQAKETSEDGMFDFVRQKRTVRKGSGLDLFTQLDDMSTRQAKEETANAPDRETARKQKALAAAFAALSDRGPLAIFFEDSHWMDESSRETLQILSRELAAKPVIFLLAGRMEDRILETGENIALDPFTKAETSAMVAAILTAGLADIIHEQSNGSPLFVEEISRWIKRTHSIDEAGLRTVLQSSDILQKLVLSSLESLPEAQREVARLASVVGEEFRRSEVEALLGDSLDQVTFSGYLQSLVQARLIVLSEASVDARYAFAQPIFRDVLYTSLPFERRRELHAQMADHLKILPNRRRQLRDKIAAFLEDDLPANPVQETEKLAYHYEMSGQWLAAARQLNETAAIVKPSEQAVADAMYNRVLTLLEHIPADEMNAENGLEKARAHWGLGDVAVRQGDLASSAASFETIAALPGDWLPQPMAIGLAARRAFVLPSQGKQAQAVKQLAAALEQFSGHPDFWKLALVQAWLSWRAGQDVRADVQLAWQHLPEEKSSRVLRARVVLDDLSGNYVRAAETYQFFEESDGLAMAYVRAGDVLLGQGDPAGASKYYDLAIKGWQSRQVQSGIALVHYRRAELVLRQRLPMHDVLAELEEAMTALGKAPVAMQTGPRAFVQQALVLMKTRNTVAWEAWQWQPFDDLFRIRFMLPIFQS